MTETSSNTAEPSIEKHVFGWLLFIVSLFPLVALLTYDWRSVAALRVPPLPSTNWVGALGDTFAYYGYTVIGLAVWIIPVVCVALGLCLVGGRRLRLGRRIPWFALLLAACACLLQVAQRHAPGISAALDRVNIANAGGVVGYLVMSRLVSPLLSDFGGSAVMAMIALVALVECIGVKAILGFFAGLYRWAAASGTIAPSREAAGSDEEYEAQQSAYLAALQAKKDAKEQARREKEQARLEKERAKAEKAAARQAEKEAIRAAKEAARAEREAARTAELTGAPAAAQAATVPPAPRPGAAGAESGEDGEPPVEDKGPYILPSTSLLAPLKTSEADHSDVSEMSQRLVSTLKLFGVDATLSYTVQGPVVTKYAIELAPGTRYSSVTNLNDNLKGALHAKSIRIEAPIPGEDRIGIEVPNRRPAGISFREIFESEAWRGAKAELPLLFGKRADGKELVADLASMPHMLVAGATGQGKSVCLNSLICGLLMTRTPEQLKLIMVDPKSVEFTPYASIPHLLVPVITDNRKVVFSLHWAVAEMEKRLKMFARARVRNIYDFNHRATFTQTDMFGNDSEVGSDIPKTVPYIVIIIDEVADLMSQCSKEVTPDISRLTAKARAAGIHLILATQRPDAKIITGTIKANIPGRVAFKTASSVDSRTILDDTGAESHRQGRHAVQGQGRPSHTRPGRMDLGRGDREHHRLHTGALERPVRREVRDEARARQGGVDRRPLRLERGRSRQPAQGRRHYEHEGNGEGQRGRRPLQARARVHHQHEPRVRVPLPEAARHRLQPRGEALRQARGRRGDWPAAGRRPKADHNGPAAAPRDIQRQRRGLRRRGGRRGRRCRPGERGRRGI